MKLENSFRAELPQNFYKSFFLDSLEIFLFISVIQLLESLNLNKILLFKNIIHIT